MYKILGLQCMLDICHAHFSRVKKQKKRILVCVRNKDLYASFVRMCEWVGGKKKEKKKKERNAI